MPRAAETSFAAQSEGEHDSDDTDVLDGAAQASAQAALGSARTLADAREFCAQLIDAQIRAAREQKAAMNTDVPGDRATRGTIALVLPDAMQRELFMRTASKPEHWPRLRSLFGAPPYQFLRAQDGALLRAAGFAVGRVNMSYAEGGARTANYAQFGMGQLTDAFEREYRLARDTEAQSLPGADYLNSVQGDVHLQVKVRKRRLQTKRSMMTNEDLRKHLSFPQPGERLLLSDSRPLVRLRGLKKASVAEVTVRAISLRSPGAATAAILVRPV